MLTLEQLEDKLRRNRKAAYTLDAASDGLYSSFELLFAEVRRLRLQELRQQEDE